MTCRSPDRSAARRPPASRPRAPRHGGRCSGRRRPRSSGACTCRAWARPRCRTISPSTRTRTNPCRRAASKIRSPSVLRSLMSGARTSRRVPSGSARTWSTICWTVWRSMRVAVGAVRDADPREQQAQVVVDLGDGPDGRSRVARGALLVDRDGRRQAVDLVDVGLLHLTQELARVGAQALDIPPLALGVDGVERQAGLAAAGQPGDDDEPVARERDVDVLEVVFACAAHDELILGHVLKCTRLARIGTGVLSGPQARYVAAFVIPPIRPAAIATATGSPPTNAHIFRLPCPAAARARAATPTMRTSLTMTTAGIP